LQAEVQVGNDVSARVLQRCGFTEYGLAPDYLRLGDGWADCRLFQLVHDRWTPSGGSATVDAEADEAGGAAAGAVVVRAQVPALGEALDLYDAVGWGAYTARPETL